MDNTCNVLARARPGLLPHCPAHRLIELAPLNWATTVKRPEAQKLLDDNRFRRLTLDVG